MRRLLVVGIMIGLLAGCASAPSLKNDMIENNWQRQVDTDPNKWLRGSDSWFLTGKNEQGAYAIELPVTPFTRIKTNGDYRIRIRGTALRHRVWIVGPKPAVAAIFPSVREDTLILEQDKKTKLNMANVTVYIEMPVLRSLSQQGCSLTEGIMLRGSKVSIRNTGAGNQYLTGSQLNVCHVYQRGTGSVNLFDVRAAQLAIDACGSGQVNASGRIDVRNITHCGSGDVNLIGACGGALCVNARGSGKVGINGNVNISYIETRDGARVYAYPIMSNRLEVLTYFHSKVALAGCARQLYVDAYQSSRFEGRDLCAETAFVKAHDNADINVSASYKLFAATTQAGSIYYFGQPRELETFVSSKGNIMPINALSNKMCFASR